MKKSLALSTLAFYFIISAIAIYYLKNIQINTKNDLFYDKNSRDYKNLVYLKRHYKARDNIVIGLSGGDIFSREGLKFITDISIWLKKQKPVSKVISIATIKTQPEKGIYSIDEIINSPDIQRSLLEDRLYRGAIISEDGKTAGIILELKDQYSDAEVEKLLDKIREKFGNRYFNLHIAGFPVDSISFTRYIVEDQRIFITVIFIIFTSVLFLFYRGLREIVYMLVLITMSIILLLAIFTVTGHELSPVTSLLIPVILTVSITDSIHIINRYQQIKRENKKSAISLTFRQMFKPCLITSLTTGAGFISLLAFRNTAISEFGIFAATGSIIALVLSMTLLFALLSCFGTSDKRAILKDIFIKRLALQVFKRRHAMILIAFILLIVSIFFIQKIDVNTDYISYLRKEDSLYKSNIFIDEHLTGINSMDLLLRGEGRELLSDPDFLSRLFKFSKFLRSHPWIEYVISPGDFYSRLLDIASIDKISPEGLEDCKRIIETYSRDEFPLYHKEGKEIRMHLRFKALKSRQILELVDFITSSSSKFFTDNIKVIPIGEVILFNKTAQYLVRYQIDSVILALMVIIGTIGLFFKSIKILLVTILPNILPVVMVYAVMGIFKIELGLATAMVASAALGLLVDDTIHFIHEYKQARASGLDPISSTGVTFKKAGLSAFITSMVLATGMGVGMLSNFKPTFYFSLLISTSIITAFICDIFITPAILMISEYKIK